jgi:hypothetical protein
MSTSSFKPEAANPLRVASNSDAAQAEVENLVIDDDGNALHGCAETGMWIRSGTFKEGEAMLCPFCQKWVRPVRRNAR